MTDISYSMHERIALLDTLRGIAVLGIFFVNVIYFGQPYSAYNFPTMWGEAEQLNTFVWAFSNLWVEDSMRALFIMLFGASTALLLSEKRLHLGGVLGVERFFRRNLILMIIGAVHALLLLAPHDVLFVYGLLAILAFPLHRLRPLLLLLLGLLMFFTGTLIRSEGAPSAASNSEVPLYQKRASSQEISAFRHGMIQEMQEDVGIYGSGYGEIFDTQKKAAIETQSIDIYQEQGFLLGGLLLIGMVMLKWGILSGRRSRRFYLLLMLAGYSLAQLLRFGPLVDVLESDFDPFVTLNQHTLAREFSQLPLALGHIGLLALLSSFATTRRFLRPFAAVGRMALTHYIGQTIFSILFFFGFGLAMFGNFERYELLLVCLAVGLAQILFSLWWLKRFRHGPLEWLWRASTRWELIPFRMRPKANFLAPSSEQANA